MAKAYLIEIHEIEIPKKGFLEGGWYAGRQYFMRTFGRSGEITSIEGGRGRFRRIYIKKHMEIIAKLLTAKRVYKYDNKNR